MNKLSYDYLSSSTKENTPINNLKDLLNSKKNSVVVSTYKKSSLSSESMLQPQMNFNDDEKNQSSLVRYNCKEILSVYFHMNYLKSFDQPKNFSGESFIKEVMYPLPKPIVECMKKKESVCLPQRNTARTKIKTSLVVGGRKRFSSGSREKKTTYVKLGNNIFGDLNFGNFSEVKKRNKSVRI